MRTKNLLNITFFITLLLISYGVSAMETTTEEIRWNSLLERGSRRRSNRTVLSQIKMSAVNINSLSDALSVDVSSFQSNCADLYTARSAISGFLNQMTNYTPEAMQFDIEKLQNAKNVISQVKSSVNSNVPSLVQVSSKAQLEEAMSVVNKLGNMKVVSPQSIDNIKSQVSGYLTNSGLSSDIKDVDAIIESLTTVIEEVVTVQSQLDSVSEVGTLARKKEALDSMIRGVCFADVDPVVNVSRNDQRDPNIVGKRYYRGWDDDFVLYEETGVNLTAPLFRDYVVGGWVRWLDFVDYTYDHEEKETVIFRLTSEYDENIEEDQKFADKHAILYAGPNYFRVCIHNTQTKDMNLCHTFDFTGEAHENSWAFFMLMYSFNTNTALARVRINGAWTTYNFPGSVVQTPTDGVISFYLGHDAFYDLGTVGFNGEMVGWNVWYGVNSWQSKPGMWNDSVAESICNKYFSHPVDVPYVELLLNPNSDIKNQVSDETSLYSFYHTFFEASDYGFGLWVKLDSARGFNGEERQIVTYAFEQRTDINTPGNNIAELYTREGSLFLQVAYERDNKIVFTEKELASLYQDDWFFVQVHFSSTDGVIKAWFQQSSAANAIEFDDVSAILVPDNVFFTAGYSHVLNYTGADFEYKGVWVYAGVQTLYGQPCNKACKTCNGPNANDCISCSDGAFLDDKNTCTPCADDCLKCGGCGTGQCTQCKPGKVLVNGNCYCDPSCQTCSGISNHDCLTCPQDSQILVNGRCVSCDASCATCSDSGPNACVTCPAGFSLNLHGQCLPSCDYSRCKTCTPDGAKCVECNSPQVLSNGDCLDCDDSCNTCTGPLPYECIDCHPGATFIDGKCIVCDSTCATCDGPNADDCLTCAPGLELAGCRCLTPCDLDNGFFRDANNNCVPCDSTCKTCKDADSCQSCDSDHVLVDGKCVLPPNPPPTCDTANGYVLVHGKCILCDFSNGFVLINDGCFPCDPSCATCNGVNDDNCLTCTNPDYTLSNGKCVPENPICVPKKGEIVNANGECVPCEINCTDCVDPNVLTSDGQCVPPPPPCDESDGYVLLSDGTCAPCDDNCATCSDVNSNNCLTCHSDKVFNPLTNTCDPPCDTEHGFVLSNGQCLPCDATCNRCNGPSYLDCVDCASGLTMVAGVCVPPCDTDNGFVLKGVTCLPCDKSCKTCKDTSNADCTSCPDGTELQAGSCVVIPPKCNITDGFVFVNNECIPCDPACKTCNDISNKDCTACFDPQILQGGSCVNPKPDCNTDAGQIIIGDECYNCSITCKTCSGVEDKDCIDCADGLVREGDYCVPPCVLEDGFYKENGACLPCYKDCATCDGPSPFDCKTCPDGYFQDNDGKCFPLNCVSEDFSFKEDVFGACKTDCDCDGTRRCSPYGECHDCLYLATTFPTNFTDAVCPHCHPTCVTCRGSRSSDCWTCLEHEFLSDGSCLPCDDSCLTCNGTTDHDCTSCDNTETLVNGTCVVPCDVSNGFYYLDHLHCLPCDNTCQTCIGGNPNDCKTCPDGFDLTADGECKKPCNTDNGFYYDANGECQPCDSTCLTCNGPSNSNCTSCIPADFLEFGRCIPSDCVSYDYIFDETNILECNSDCECDGTRRCSPAGTCEDCNTLVKEYPDLFSADVCPPCHYTCNTCRGPNDNDCTDCLPGEYFDNGSCPPCDKSCQNCTGPSSRECTSCDNTHVLRGTHCVEPCDTDNGYFYNSDEVCTPCDDTCKTCHNADKDGCDSCYGSYILDNGICKPPCDENDGYTYDDNFNCVPCTDPCSLCSAVGDDKCTECKTGFTLSDGHCVNCVSFYYDHNEYDNLNGPSQCSSDCECDNTRRCGPDGICENCLTLATAWPDLFDSKDCPPCDKDCLTCNGPSSLNCTSCVPGEYLGSDGGCYPCDDSCTTCDGPGADECTGCPDGLILKNGECVVPPVVCDVTCLECSGPSKFNCTKCGDDYELADDGECVPKNCVAWDYKFDEETAGLGAHRCDDDCECDGTRRCSPDKYCAECLDLVYLYPSLYDLKECPPCDSSCQTCSGPDADQCNSCVNGEYLTASNTCEPCDENCALCSGTATNCTGCKSGLVLNDNNTCVIPCDPSCNECSGPAANECTKCDEDETLINGECIKTPVCVKLDYVHDESTNVLGPSACINDCDCDNSRRCSPDGFCRECIYLATLYPTIYDAADCPPCDDTCLTCQGPSANDCTYCPDGRVLIGGKCEPCDSTCLTCSDVDAQHCLTCPTDKILKDGECVDPPIICNQPCLECSGPKSGDCTKCPDDLVLTDGNCVAPNCVSWDYKFDEVDGRCNTDCDCDNSRRCSPDKYCQECDDLASEFPALYPPSECPPCDKSCAACNGPNDDDCTVCPNGFALVNGQCKPCDASCATCSGLTDHDCKTCFEGYVLDDGVCVLPPPPCHSSCYTCSGTTDKDCTSCEDGFYLAWDNSCQPIEKCVKWGYTHDESANLLGPSRCYDDCDCDGTRRCSPTGYCRECLDLASAYPDTYNTNDCPVCDKSCLTCNGPTEKDCTSCADTFVLVDGSCPPCNSPCLTCAVNPDDCTSCPDGLLLSNDTCVEPPKPCVLSPDCLECDDNGCTKCADDFELVDGECQPINCVAFDYVFDEKNSPLGAGRCNDDCECDGSRRCSPDKYCGECLDLVNEFPTIYAFSDCPICDKSCGTCDGPSDKDCTGCNDGFVLVDGSCEPCDPSCVTCKDTTVTGCIVCPFGYDLQADGSCQKHIDCDKLCLTCNGPNSNQCTSCVEGRTLVNGQCVLTCVDYDYVTEEAADGSCTTDCDCDGTRRCSPSGNCEDCDYLDNLYPSLYDSADCPPCDTSCAACRGPTDKDCKKCVDGEFLDSDGSCQPCDKTCLTCDAAGEGSCTSCESPLVLVSGFCVTPPINCDDTCKTCNDNGPFNCTSCYDGDELQDDGSCQPINCVAWTYYLNELLNVDGPHKCADNCECDGTRVCLPNGVCAECLDAVELLPTLFDITLCPPCHESCKRCSGPTYLDCKECEDDEVLIDGQCFPCDSSCLTCHGTASDECDTCPEGEELNDKDECVVPPPVCDKACLTCFGPTANNCSSCSNDTVLVNSTCIDPKTCDSFDFYVDESLNALGPNQCSSDCDCDGTRKCSPYGYCHECLYLAEKYPDVYDSSDCPPCDDSCATCDGPNPDQCLTCKDGFYLDGKDEGTCEPCDSSCETCYGPDSDNCLSCPPPKELHDGFCDIIPPVCDPNAHCLACKGPLPTDCIECPDHYQLSDAGTCDKINCISFDYVHDETLNVLGPHECEDDCDCDGARRCSPNGYCEDCLTLAELYPSSFLASDCPPCHSSCELCDGPTDRNCTKCPDGVSLFNGECIPCDKECLTCFGPDRDNCLSCPIGQVLFEQQCFTPNNTCDDSCVTCDGVTANDCTSCPCDYSLQNGKCVYNAIECDGSCLTCWGPEHNQCRTCDVGKVLLAGECVTVSSFFGFRNHEDQPMSYSVANKYTTGSDIGLGSWTKFKSFVPKEADHKYNLLFRLSGLTADDKMANTNKYRFSTLAVYYNATHYTFETYSKISGTAQLIQKVIPVRKNDLENKWNLVFFGYSRKHATATGFIKLSDGTHYEVSFKNIYQDFPEEKMEVFFYGDNVYNGFNGEVSSPEVLHGNNFLQEFIKADHQTYFKLKKN